MLIILLFILGLFIGSFLNVLIDRIPAKKPVFFDRSKCDYCGKELSLFDLIPVISFLWLKGRCRYCNKRLSYTYPIIESTTAILFALTPLLIFNFQFSIFNQLSIIQLQNLVLYLFLISIMIVVFFTDLRSGIIPDKIVFSSLLIIMFYLLLFNMPILLLNLLVGIGLFIFFLLIIIFTRGRGMGMGDAKFSLFLGVALGFPLAILGVYFAFLTGAIWGFILILRREKTLKSTIPFGPFLVIGSLLALFLGERLLSVLL